MDINKVLNPSKDILETSGESRGLETGAVAVAQPGVGHGEYGHGGRGTSPKY